MTTDLRFVHAADIHLGAPFKRVGADDTRVREALLRASECALNAIVDLCVDRDVDFLVLSGDVLDGTEKNLRAQLIFQRSMERLAEANIPAYVARGNHDHDAGWDAGLGLPETVHYFATDEIERVSHMRDDAEICALYGRGHPGSGVTEDYARDFSRSSDDAFAIGVLHTNVGGREGQEDYAPSTLDDLRQAGMDYWALGHIHAHGAVLEEPPAEYPGSPQGLDPNEPGVHGCILVDVHGGRIEREFIATDAIRWASLEIDLAEEAELGDVRDALRAAVAETSAAEDRPLIVRVRVRGRSTAHRDLAQDGARNDLRDDAREYGMGLDPWVWVDRLESDVGRVVDVEALGKEGTFLGELVRNALAAEKDAESLLDDVLGSVSTSGATLPDLDDDASEIVRRARDLCLDMLSRDEG